MMSKLKSKKVKLKWTLKMTKTSIMMKKIIITKIQLKKNKMKKSQIKKIISLEENHQ